MQSADLPSLSGGVLERFLSEEGADFNAFPLSYAQERLWFLDQLTPNSPLYNIPVAIRLTGRLDPDALEEGFRRIVHRHETLRTTFVSVSGRPLQVISPTANYSLLKLDLRDLHGAERENEARKLARAEAQRPFDLARGPLMRTTLLRLGEEDHALLLTMHHIISDGWSLGVLFRELKAHLEAIGDGRQATLSPLPIQYADYAMWQREWLQGEFLKEQLAYWSNRLNGGPPALKLPSDRPRPATQSFRGARLGLDLAADLSDALKALSRQEGVTLFITMLAAFKALLYCYTGQEDIVVASSIANRNRAEIENLIGLFINILALRTDLSGDPTFRELLGRVREVSLGAYAHQDLPFEKLIAETHPDRVANYAPMTQVGFTLRNAPVEDLKIRGLSLSPFKEIDTTTAKTDLMLYLVESPRGITGAVEYSLDLFDTATIERMIEGYRVLLEAIVANPRRRLSTLPSLIGQSTPKVEATPPRAPVSDDPLDHSNLTRSQMLYWIGQKVRPDAPLFNVINAFIIPKRIDVGRLKNAFQGLINSSDALRTVIYEEGGTPQQKVLPELLYPLDLIDLSSFPDPEAELEKWLDGRSQVVFNLEERLFESALIKISNEKFAWYINHHQLIGDAWATLLMCQRLSQLYSLSLKDGPAESAAFPQFRDYVELERKYRRSPRFSKVEDYWKRKMVEPVEPMTIYGKAPAQQTIRGKRTHCRLGRERIEKLRALSAREDIFMATEDLSLFNIFATLLFVYLYRISGNRRISIRIMQHNRLTKNFAETIGMFMETLPLRTIIEEGETFLSLIRKVSAEVMETLKQGRHTIITPAQHKTFEASLNYINAPVPTFDGSPTTVKWIHPGSQNEMLNLHVRKLDSSGSLALEFDFDCDAFTDQQQEQMVQRFLRLIDVMSEEIDSPIDRPDLFLTEARRQRISSLESEATFDFE